MSIEGYDAFDDPRCCPCTTVLKNLLNIQDQNIVDAFEVEISTLRSEEPPPEGNFDAAHYRQVHHHLFQDVYEWAGQLSNVIHRLIRSGLRPPFCFRAIGPRYIPAGSDHQFFGNREPLILELLNLLI